MHKIIFFGQPLNTDDNILLSLQTSISMQEEDEFRDVLRQLLKGIITVMERQMNDYLTGDLSIPTEHMLKQAKSAPVHNIMSERILGMTDHQTHRAANATMGFIEGKVKASTNKTLQWLDCKEYSEQDRMILFAVKRAREVRGIRKIREDDMKKVYQHRQKMKHQKREETYRKKVERNIKCMIATAREVDTNNFLMNVACPRVL